MSAFVCRCDAGMSLHTFHGNFFVRSTDLLSLPCVNPDLGYTINIAIDDNLKDIGSVCFQAALLYTSSRGGLCFWWPFTACRMPSGLWNVYSLEWWLVPLILFMCVSTLYLTMCIWFLQLVTLYQNHTCCSDPFNSGGWLCCMQHVCLCVCFSGERRIRVHTLCVPVATQLAHIYARLNVLAITTTLANMGMSSHIQRTPSGWDLGTNRSVLIKGVASFQGGTCIEYSLCWDVSKWSEYRGGGISWVQIRGSSLYIQASTVHLCILDFVFTASLAYIHT